MLEPIKLLATTIGVVISCAEACFCAYRSTVQLADQSQWLSASALWIIVMILFYTGFSKEGE